MYFSRDARRARASFGNQFIVADQDLDRNRVKITFVKVQEKKGSAFRRYFSRLTLKRETRLNPIVTDYRRVILSEARKLFSDEACELSQSDRKRRLDQMNHLRLVSLGKHSRETDKCKLIV